MDSSRDRCGQSSCNHGAGVTLQRCPRHALLPASICRGWMVGDLRLRKVVTGRVTVYPRFDFPLVFKGLIWFVVGDLGIEPSMRLREGVTVPCHTLRPVAHLTMPSSACRGQIAVRSRPVKRECGLVVYHSDFSGRAMFPRARSPQPATLRSPGITTPPSAFRKMLIAAL